MIFTDDVELFRRTRFEELSKRHGRDTQRWISFLEKESVLSPDHLKILRLRLAYARGDVEEMKRWVEQLPPPQPAHRLFEAILENVDQSATIRRLSSDRTSLTIPLNKEYLLRGIPVIEAVIYGRQFLFLWDTGSIENIMSENTAAELNLAKTKLQFPVLRDKDGYVVRVSATHTSAISFGNLKWSNFPWLVSDLRTVNANLRRNNIELDGILSPQLLLNDHCFIIDRSSATLEIFLDSNECTTLTSQPKNTIPIYSWNGELFTSVQISGSPLLGARLETGSNASFFRHDAVRYLPSGSLTENIVDFRGEVIRTLDSEVILQFGDRDKPLSAIELEASRMTTGHDDLATLGTDLLIKKSDRLMVNLASMTLGYIDEKEDDHTEPGRPKFGIRRLEKRHPSARN